MRKLKQAQANMVYTQFAINAARISENDPFTILFEPAQEITNGTVQKDGSYYDIATLDIERWNGKLMSNHNTNWQDRLGTVIGKQKDATSDRVTIAGIRFNRSHPEAKLAIDMAVDGLLEFSTGTLGYTEDDGARRNHTMYELSLVGVGNNDYTEQNDSLLAAAVHNGIDLSKYKLTTAKENNSMKYFIYNTNAFAVKVKFKNEAGEDQELEVPASSRVEAPSAEVASEAQGQVDTAKAPEPTQAEKDAQAAADKAAADAAAGNSNGVVSKADFDALATSLNELKKNMNTPAKPNAGNFVETNSIGTGTGNTMQDKVKSMNAGQRLFQQIMLERNGQKHSEEFAALNEFNTQELEAKGVVNAMDDSAGSLGGLIPPYELLDKIVQCETNYDQFLAAFGFQDAGLSYGWNVGIGDIEFAPVGYCAPSAQDGFEVGLENRTQERLATHSVICNKVSRFSPVNVVNIVASRYQQAYKRALVAFALAEMQVAVDKRVAGWNRASGTDVAADPNGSLDYPAAGQGAQIALAVSLFTNLADCVQGGTYVMNAQTAAKLILDFNLTGTGDSQSTGGTTRVNNYGALGVALGGTVIVVPNNMLPTLGTASTVTVVRTTEGGGNVTIDHAIFYTHTDNWYGVTNGALQFDIDSFGSYEVAVTKTVTGGGGGTVTVVETRSAKQRGETVLFGEMYRGGGILDFRAIGGIKALLSDES